MPRLYDNWPCLPSAFSHRHFDFSVRLVGAIIIYFAGLSSPPSAAIDVAQSQAVAGAKATADAKVRLDKAAASAARAAVLAKAAADLKALADFKAANETRAAAEAKAAAEAYNAPAVSNGAAQAESSDDDVPMACDASGSNFRCEPFLTRCAIHRIAFSLMLNRVCFRPTETSSPVHCTPDS